MSRQPGDSPHSEPLENLLLGALLDADGYVSGQRLCDVAGVSRAAVWKHIERFEALGFTFDRRRGLGYRVTHVPDLLLEPLVQRKLPTASELGRHVVWKPAVDSTNDEATRLAAAGAVHGTIATALVQRRGRGRHGRAWTAPAGGLWQSIILRDAIPLQRAAEITLIAAVAIRRALSRHTSLPIAIKWPNDLLCRGRKLCGILAETRSVGETVEQTVLGIGINTNISATDMPSTVRGLATSTLMEAGVHISHLDFEVDLLAELSALLASLREGGPGFRSVSAEWRAASATLGQRVRVLSGGRVIEGEAVELDDDGVLHVRADGATVRILSGDVL